MISWATYTRAQAEKDFNNLTVDTLTSVSLSSDFMSIRQDLIKTRDIMYDMFDFDAGIPENMKHTFDLFLGLGLYESLNGKITNRDIYTDDIWRFLSIKVIPDIIHARWGLAEGRYYEMSRRIYLKQIWWYVHLGWKENLENTYKNLENNSTDTIQSVVERPGLGYNVDLYREIMKQYASHKDRLLLRRVMVLNTARSKNVTPELVKGGIPGYVSQLFKDVL